MVSIFTILTLFFVAECKVFDKPEGSPCEWKDLLGTCVNIRRCQSEEFKKMAKDKDRAPICSFDGLTPIVCCVDCDILPESQQIKDPLDKEFYKSENISEARCLAYQYLLPYECKTHVTFRFGMMMTPQRCAKYITSAVAPIGGEDAKRGDFPHMALLGYGPSLQSAEWLCGGSLISDRHILTAGHCAAHQRLGPVRYVSLGMLKRSDAPSYWRQYGVRRFIPHPEYKPPNKYNDIAIIETDTVVNWTEGVRPACISHKRVIEGDEGAVATGWGSLGPRRPHADVMQKVYLKKLSTEECSELYPPNRNMPRGFDPETQMCYGDYDQPRDTCNGDSGGPLQLRDWQSRTCVYVVHGVTSTGRACSATSRGGIYTRVAHYTPWIEGVVWPPNKQTIKDAQ